MGQVPDDLKDVIAVEAEVDTLRERTQSLVDELERRLRARAEQAKTFVESTRHTLDRMKHVVDVGAQLHEHPRAVIGVSSAAALALGLGVYFSIAHMLERRKPMHRLRDRFAAYRGFLSAPERMAPRSSLGKRLITAVLVAGAVTIARGLTVMLVTRKMAPRLLAPPRPRPHQLT